MYSVRYSAQALKALGRMPADTRRLIVRKIDEIAAEPHGRHVQAKALTGRFKGMFRLRIGNWRVIYALEERVQVLRVAYVRKREDAYD